MISSLLCVHMYDICTIIHIGLHVRIYVLVYMYVVLLVYSEYKFILRVAHVKIGPLLSRVSWVQNVGSHDIGKTNTTLFKFLISL